MDILEILNKKRKKQELTKEEIEFFVAGVTSGKLKDYEISALLMAISINGMTSRETTDLTLAMASSGDVLNLDDIVGTKVDKHSSGGVSDTTTLILAPILAVCGLKVAKMSGRGLGFTGGTIDKLEAISGFKTELSEEEFKNNVNKVGACIMCQTACLAPADKVLYALRDQTATVESLPLIASSIMSKKLASGAEVILLDVKCGRGAFMKTQKDAEQLAKAMVEIGKNAGKKIVAVVTDMNYPLGSGIGCALEVNDAINVLNGAENNLADLSKFFASKIISMATGKSEKESKNMVENAINSKSALKKFVEIVSSQGGDALEVEKLALKTEKKSFILTSKKYGYVADIDAIKLSKIVALFGGARTEIGGKLNHKVGVKLLVSVGDKVTSGQELIEVFSNKKLSSEVQTLLEESIIIENKKVKKPQIIKKIID